MSFPGSNTTHQSNSSNVSQCQPPGLKPPMSFRSKQTSTTTTISVYRSLILTALPISLRPPHPYDIASRPLLHHHLLVLHTLLCTTLLAHFCLPTYRGCENQPFLNSKFQLPSSFPHLFYYYIAPRTRQHQTLSPIMTQPPR